MIGSLTEYWKYSPLDVWGILGRSRRAPPDLFIELYRRVTDFLEVEPPYEKFESAMNDPVIARQAFEEIGGQEFAGELSVIGFLESAFDTIREFEIPRFEQLYRYLVRLFVKKYNLTYRIDDPFRVRLVLPGVFSTFYDNLTRVNRGDPHLAKLMSDFECAFGSYARTREGHNLNACITNAFVYAEGVAAKTYGKHETLGELCNCLKCWPHATVRESLKKLYGFRCDFPGLGHAGNPSGKLRDLEPRDAIVVSLLVLAFSGYLTNEVRIEDIFAR